MQLDYLQEKKMMDLRYALHNKPEKYLSDIKNFLIAMLAILVCGILSVHFGKDLQGDLAGYHYYNPYAFLHNRWNVDMWPANYVHIFYNPTIDFMTYFLISRVQPLWVQFFVGGLHGLNLWLLFHLSYTFLVRYENKLSVLFALFFASVGMYGPIAFSEIGSFMGDNFVSIFILSTVLLHILILRKYMRSNQLSTSKLLLSGFLLGFAIGLKLTTSYFLVGIVLAYMFIPMLPRYRFEVFFMTSIAALIGFLIADGYWMYFLWKHFHNPFYPLFTDLFQAPAQSKFLPRNFWQILFYPFYFSTHGQLVSDYSFVDFRFMIVYVLLVVSGLIWFMARSIPALNLEKDYAANWLILFFLFSYVAWQFSFSNIYCLVSLEMLAPVVIYLLLHFLMRSDYVRLSFTVFFLTLIALTMSPIYRERLSAFGSDYFNVSLPHFVRADANALVLTLTPNDIGKKTTPDMQTIPIAVAENVLTSPASLLQTYLIPYFPASTRFVGLTVVNSEYTISTAIKKIIAKHTGDFYLLTSAANMPSLVRVAKTLGLKNPVACGYIDSDRMHLRILSGSKVMLCSLQSG